MTHAQYLTIKELPEGERPRERLEKLGADSLSDAELLAIILRTGASKLSAVDLARHIIRKFGTLKALAKASIEELCEIPGIGKTKAVQIKAAFALGTRFSNFRDSERPAVRTAKDVLDLMADEMRLYDKECFKILLLDTKNRLIRAETVSVGTLNASLVHPREVFRIAIRANCSSIIVAHNHPSGDPSPSGDDDKVTNRLKEAASLLGIDLLDHIIIGDRQEKNYFSYRDQGMI